ncbi:MAG: serine hydrolase domain-containing protein, partial [Ginsengibacter sp.]
MGLTKQASPGAVIAIVRNDSVLFEKGYGMANAEYNISNTPESIYYICSLAKQFTAYSIILLADQHKLKLDDDITLYLPWTKNFGEKITIRNLLHHTSGIRDDLDLLKISGVGRNGIISQDLALNILKQQHSLNFPPGTKYSYSNSNYILLAEIVKVVNKQSFSQFTDSAIFKPLQMLHAHFYENPFEVIHNRAVSYNQTDSGKYQNSFQNVYTVGDGGLFMSMNDMTLWVMNYFNNKIGNAHDIETLNEKSILNNGEEADGTNFKVKGWNTYQYNGGLNGYKTFITIFPDFKTGFIVFANNGDDNIYNLYNPLTDLFIPLNRQISKDNHADIGKIISDSNQLKKFCGDYIAGNNFHLHFNIDNGKLSFAQGQFLLQQSSNTFLFAADTSIRFVFKKEMQNN